MPKRFSGRISEVLASHRFDSREDMETNLERYCHLYSRHILERALNHQTPIHAMKDWQTAHQQLFIRQVRSHARPDT